MFWISFEGLDGSGKTTQAAMLAERLDAVLTREPGGTSLGERLRHELLHTDGEIDSRTEMLLYAADRSHHLNCVVLPALAANRCVVSDRSVWSSVAYQGYGRGLGASLVHQVNEAALSGTWPHAVVLLDVPRRETVQRMDRALDRIESAPESFHVSVARGFAELASEFQWIVVDGSLPVTTVHDMVVAALSASLGEAFLQRVGSDSATHDN